jgi:hypothetical protein
MLVINLRQGFGFDIEYNEDICHIVDNGEPHDTLFAYSGIILLLPFLKIYLGEFDQIGELIPEKKKND